MKHSHINLAKVGEIELGMKIFCIKTSRKMGYSKVFKLGGV